jgi:Domain of unknown function (DUF4232)
MHARRRARARRMLTAVVGTLALIGAGAASGAAIVPRCTAPNLSLEFARGQGATSHRFWDLALRNVGPATCELRGYPGIGLLDSGGRLMNVPVDRKATAANTVVMHPWDRAFFTFSFTVSAPCAHGLFPFGIQVIPPNTTQWLRMYKRFDVCGGSRPTVTPVRATL